MYQDHSRHPELGKMMPLVAFADASENISPSGIDPCEQDKTQ